jgi:hypothetical protein
MYIYWAKCNQVENKKKKSEKTQSDTQQNVIKFEKKII